MLKLTARNTAEKSRALAEFVRAVELDKRRVLPEARLHRALALIENKETSQLPEIVATLKEYVGLYQRENGGRLPPNMDVIYDTCRRLAIELVVHPSSISTNTSTPSAFRILRQRAPSRPVPATGGRRP